MDCVIRGAIVYLFVWLVFRIAGKRTLHETTTFDLVLLLIISETTQQAMIGHDHSLTAAFLLIITIVGIDILTSFLKDWSGRFERIMDGLPLVLLEDGQLLRDRMAKVRIDQDDILAAARESHGLQHLDQIQYAVLERNGRISIIPRNQT